MSGKDKRSSIAESIGRSEKSTRERRSDVAFEYVIDVVSAERK